MNLLYIHQYFCPPGGAGNNRSFEIAAEWVKAGHQVTMLTSTAYFPENLCFSGPVKEMDIAGIRVIALNVAYKHMMGFKERIKAFLRFYRAAMTQAKQLPIPDLIYASSTPPTVGEMGRKLARRWNIPFVFETVDVWPDVPQGMGILKNRLLLSWLHRRTNRIYAAADLIVALSDGMAEQVCSHIEDHSKVVVRYNGTNPQAFPFEPRVPQKSTEVIYTGTVGKANGIDALLLLCKDVEASGRSDIHFTVLGGGNALENAKAQAIFLNLKQLKFIATVPKEEVAGILANAAIGIVTFAPYPVLEANSANKFYDYLSSGLPVLLNYEGWQAKYLQEHSCGLSTKMGDRKGLFENLIRLVDDPDLRQRMGKQGREVALKYFDRREIAKQLLVDFDTILSKK